MGKAWEEWGMWEDLGWKLLSSLPASGEWTGWHKGHIAMQPLLKCVGKGPLLSNRRASKQTNKQHRERPHSNVWAAANCSPLAKHVGGNVQVSSPTYQRSKAPADPKSINRCHQGGSRRGKWRRQAKVEAWFSNSGKNNAEHDIEVISVGGEKKTKILKSERETDGAGGGGGEKWGKKWKWNDLRSSGKKVQSWIEELKGWVLERKQNL